MSSVQITPELLQHLIQETFEEVTLEEAARKKRKRYPRQYGARPGTKRKGKLDRATAMAKSDDPDVRRAGFEARERMERAEREKPGWHNRPRRDTKKEVHEMEDIDVLSEGEELLRDLIAEVLTEALSAKVKATLRKKAEARGLTPGSVYAEYRKGLAAWGTSGSRKGVSQHAWAMARVNSANPSKGWAVVKKSKAKKKK